ncbi:dTDP-4-dehydrorhamnose reductase [Pseudoxanthomonas daejeonensis]|uniref:dTDP-4-dehydrorhamnose reductase n=1 Tax=Pseudoxanthomonas daejeonensis TaxID=266062 RepID=UPI001F54746D|nr:dTDP-4-dehydrorhamnose reductase [Pseudoxanthomonas daejeonensis]UNK56459.1 dTDP-4-dehydrorhamnose reductase [Pseudoxanthomonas daejeonensis]
MKRILLVGANGQVGRELRRSLQPLGRVVAATRDGRVEGAADGVVADLSDPAGLEVLVAELAPDAVVNAAAYTAVDKAESDAIAAYVANAEAPAALARACAVAGIPLVHFSTDYVFDGKAAQPYRVDAATEPLGVYGASKLAGEVAVRAAGGQHLIFRTAWVYATHGRNFLRTMLRLGGERDELRVVADQVGTPTPAALIADVTAVALARAMTDSEVSGTWHLVAAGQTTWHGFAEAIFAEAVASGLLARAPRVLPISSAEYPAPARRPAYSCLDTASLVHDFPVELPEWRSALHGVIGQLADAGGSRK